MVLAAPATAARTVVPAPEADGGGDDDSGMRERYDRWAAKHGRTHKDPATKAHRYRVWKSNAGFVDSYNAANNSSLRMGINRFSDLTDEEFEATYLVGGTTRKRFAGAIPGFMYVRRPLRRRRPRCLGLEGQGRRHCCQGPRR